MEIYADMVKIHYEYYKNKRKNNEKYKSFIPKNIEELKEYTDIDSMVFENKDNNELIVAMRGLDKSSSRDLLIGADILYKDAYQQGGFDFDSSVGKYREILLKDQKKIEELKAKYPNKKIVLTGHSRGGRKAIDLGEHNQMEYHSFQPAEMNRLGGTALNFIASAGMEAILPTGAIEREMWKSLYGGKGIGGRVINNLMFEFGSPLKIGKNVLSSSIGADNYQSVAKRFVAKTLTPSLTHRTIEGATNFENPFYEPINFNRMPSNTFNEDSLNMIEPVVNFFNKDTIEERKPPTKSISNIYKTERDIVSKGFKADKIIEPRSEAFELADYMLGSHGIDHFISDEMFNLVHNKEPKEEPIFSPQPKPQTQKEEEITPVPYEYREADTRSLCRKYPNYSPQCKFILR